MVSQQALRVGRRAGDGLETAWIGHMDRLTISIEDFCGALYCARARPTALRPNAAGQIRFTARSTNGGRRAYYRAEFDAVQVYRWRSTGPAPRWGRHDRVELSVIELTGEPGSWRVWFNPWYLHEMEFSCTRIRLNGAEVVGRGKHLQDELPLRAPLVPPYSPGAA
jgi:hypothetical protein